MTNKRFSPELSEKHDAQGKRLAIEIMRDVSGAVLIAENTKETAGIFTDGFWDQKYEKNGKEVFVEPEMKDEKWWGAGWNSYPFRYPTMNIPYRKFKNKADIFMVISTCESLAWLVNKKTADKHCQEIGGPIKKYTKYEPNGGDYYNIPVEKGLFVQKIEGKWVKWKN